MWGLNIHSKKRADKKDIGFHGGLTREEIMVNVWKFEK
jgi:hypothetical protein